MSRVCLWPFWVFGVFIVRWRSRRYYDGNDTGAHYANKQFGTDGLLDLNVTQGQSLTLMKIGGGGYSFGIGGRDCLVE